MKTRNWSIRSKIIALVAVPVSALLALWIFATVLTIGPAFNLLSAQTLLDTVGKPGEVLVAELQKERKLSVVQLSGGAGGSLGTQRAVTDRAVADFRSAAGGSDARDAATPQLQSRIDQIFVSLDGLAGGRAVIDRRTMEPSGVQKMFDGIIDSAFRMFSAMATFEDPQIDREIRALTMIGRGREWLSRSDSLLAGANAGGEFTDREAGDLIQAIGTQRYLYTEAVVDLPTGDRDAYERLTSGDAFVRLQGMQDELVQSSRAGAAPPVRAGDWQPAYDSAVQQLRAYEINATESLAGRATPVAVDILLRLALAGILGLTAVVVSIVVSVRVGRSLIGRLVRLRAAALEMAGERLPSVVRRLRRGEVVDVESETPPLEYGTDEIGQLGRAFTEVQRTAVRSAVDEAGVRRGLNEVFLNIARRSQTLLHRQLALLDRMERRETDSQELEDLYRVDHLATRMRRHAEDLVILAGAAPGRGWRNPVPLIDVVRGAISEVEDYKRVDVSAVEASSVVGRAVGDIIHLLAELLENAASFSPPHTRVQVAGQIVPNGYVVEIEDRGLGMSAEAFADANRRLAEPPDFDPADSARLGLFVVALLANRHGIRVQLRPSPYGGVTAVALIPSELITAAGPVALPAGPSASDRSWDRQPTAPTGTTALRGPASLAGSASLRGPAQPVGSVAPAGSVPLDTSAALTGVAALRASAGRGSDGPADEHVRQALTALRIPEQRAAAGHTTAGHTTDGHLTAGSAAPVSPAQSTSTPVAPTAGSSASIPPVPLVPGVPDLVPSTSAEPAPRVSGGPTAGARATDGLAVDGLAQRRRIVPRPRTGAPGGPSGPTRPASPEVSHAMDAPTVAAGIPVVGEDGLPRRVRQASLMPQLRKPVVEQQDATPRSPEEVRDLMSALQLGTTRGRIAALRKPAPPAGEPADPPDRQPAAWFAGEPDSTGPAPGISWADAATAGYPVTRDPAGAAADAESVVHYGEIVPREAPGADPPSPDPTARPDGEDTQLEKDA